MKLIQLRGGFDTMVDDIDFEFLSQWEWYILKAAGGLHYAVRSEDGASIRMHRVINGTPTGLYTNHKDGNGLNNQRHNLRTATPLQNMMNRRGKRGGTSVFKGVWLDISHPKKPWRAGIRINGSIQYLGRFSSEEDAGAAYAVAAIEHFGDFACILPGETR